MPITVLSEDDVNLLSGEGQKGIDIFDKIVVPYRCMCCVMNHSCSQVDYFIKVFYKDSV